MGGSSFGVALISIDMPYKVKKGFEKYFVSAKIKDGRERVAGYYGDFDQETLAELYALGLEKYIKKTGGRPKKKKRDNAPDEPLPTLNDEPQKD